MEITLDFLKAVYNLYYQTDGFWEDLNKINQFFLDKCNEYLNELLSKGKIKATKYLEYVETIKNMNTILLNSTLEHSEMKDCRNDYSWVDFTTTINLSNGKKYLLSGEFCPADGYEFQELKEMTN